MTLVTTAIVGIVYPLVITGLAQVLFPDQADDQLVERHGAVVGSRLIGQGFSSPGYFRSPPEAGSRDREAISLRTDNPPTAR